MKTGGAGACPERKVKVDVCDKRSGGEHHDSQGDCSSDEYDRCHPGWLERRYVICWRYHAGGENEDEDACQLDTGYEDGPTLASMVDEQLLGIAY